MRWRDWARSQELPWIDATDELRHEMRPLLDEVAALRARAEPGTEAVVILAVACQGADEEGEQVEGERLPMAAERLAEELELDEEPESLEDVGALALLSAVSVVGAAVCWILFVRQLTRRHAALTNER